MSFGKLYSYEGNPRTTVLLALAKENKLDVELVETRPPTKNIDYLKYSPLDRVPTFVAPNGWVLSESIAIAIYFASQNEKTTLLGKTKQDYAQIVRWLSYANSEVLTTAAGWVRPLLGKDPYNKAAVEVAKNKTEAVIKVLEDHFLVNTFLVGERITLADLFLASASSRAFETVFDKQWRKDHPHFTRWYETVVYQPLWQAVVPKPVLVEEAVKYTPPKKEPKPAKAAEPKPKAAAPAAQDDDDDEPKPVVEKVKHPLESLGKPTMIMDEWKRKYSNEDTRPVALPWFWEHYKPDEYSLWQVAFKYNDELTMTFMSANLIGGFYARLEASRKYLFGAMSVYGKTNDSIIRGVFLVRGQDAVPAFDVAPDWESYEFTKLDPSKTADKEFVENEWAWDKPATVGDKTYEWADGKVFK